MSIDGCVIALSILLIKVRHSPRITAREKKEELKRGKKRAFSKVDQVRVIILNGNIIKMKKILL